MAEYRMRRPSVAFALYALYVIAAAASALIGYWAIRRLLIEDMGSSDAYWAGLAIGLVTAPFLRNIGHASWRAATNPRRKRR